MDSPRERDDYLALVIPAMEFLYEDETHPEVMKMLRGAGQHAEILAQATLTIIRSALRKSGQVPTETVLQVATEVLEDLTLLADVAMIFRRDAQVTSVAARRVRTQLTH